jgi:hypothetical protein
MSSITIFIINIKCQLFIKILFHLIDIKNSISLTTINIKIIIKI